MSNDVAVKDKGSIMESVMIKGDLSKLTPEERSVYYMKVCESVGLNPLTKPFEYIVLNGKMTLYALRTATDQLRSVYGVSVEELAESEKDGVFVVTAKVKNRDGRTDIAKGAVNINNLKGEALANALMKAETKAKRRATLSICGLGMLDETEVETIPQAKSVFVKSSHSKLFLDNVIKSFDEAKSEEDLKQLAELNKPQFEKMETNGNEYDLLALEELRKRYQIALNRFRDVPIEELDPRGEFEMPHFLGRESDHNEQPAGA